MQLADRLRVGIATVAIVAGTVLGGCASQRPPEQPLSSPSETGSQQPATGRVEMVSTTSHLPYLDNARRPGPGRESTVNLALPALGGSPGGGNRSRALPESGFVDERIKGITRDSPREFYAPGVGMGVLLGHGGGDQYTAGLGWVPGSDPDRLKVSLLRQQTLDREFQGNWLASAKGESVATVLGGDYDVEAELAMLDGGANTAVGGRVRVSRPLNDSLSYRLGLSHFGAGFQPRRTLVEAGTETARADINYRLWSDSRLSASVNYSRKNTGGISRCELLAGLSLSGSDLFQPFEGTIETSLLQSGNCGADDRRQVSRWNLSLAEDSWSGWNLHLAMSGTAVLPSRGRGREEQVYRLESRRQWRHGDRKVFFGPMVSLRVVDARTAERHLKTGVVLSLDALIQHISFHMGYESHIVEDRFVEHNMDIKMKYEFDLDV